jgi:hypothetical protein
METIQKNNVIAFGRNLHHVPQQMQSRLIETVDSDLSFTDPGEYFTDEQLGAVEWTEFSDHAGDTPFSESQRGRRGAYFRNFEAERFFKTVDKLYQLVDATDPTIVSIRWGLARHRTQRIWNGLLDPVREGKTLENTLALPGSQIDTSAGVLTIDKLRNASKVLNNGEVLEMEAGGAATMSFVGGASQKDNLLATTQVTSSDYNSVKALVNGDVDTFMGFKFYWFADKRVPKTAGGRFRCAAYTKSAGSYRARPIVGGENAQMWQRPDKRGNWQAYASMQDAFMRRYDEAVVEVQCG